MNWLRQAENAAIILGKNSQLYAIEKKLKL